MLYLSPILLCISLNVLLIISAFILNKKEISLNKASIILISIFLVFTTFISMELGKLCSICVFKNYSSIFGGTLLSLIGIYYLIEYKKKMEYSNGLDTSFYYEPFQKYRQMLLNPSLIDKNKSNCIEINESLYISIPLSLYSIPVFFAAGITSVNMPFSMLLVFISTSLILSVNSYKRNIYCNQILKIHSLAIIGILLIITGMFEIFI